VPTLAVRYHVAVHSLAERVLGLVRRQEMLRAGDRVGVASSGGIDSVALLRLLLELRGELGIVLSVVHFNHKLRGDESEADERFVANLARVHDLEFLSDSDDVAQQAAQEHISVETAARELRYGFFRHLLGEDGEGGPQGLKPAAHDALDGAAEALPVPGSGDSSRSVGLRPEFVNAPDGAAGSRALSRQSKIVTGHTLDDQAETVLMRMIRGAGLRGLGGIYPRIVVEDDDGELCGEIVRPLLMIRRRELEQYLKEIGQNWREDSTNTDTAFTRNRVRRLVLPLLEKEFNPAVAEGLAELAEIARGEEDYWQNEVAGWMGTAVHWAEPDWARDALGRADMVQTSLVQIAPVVSGAERNSSANEELRARIENARWLVMDASVDRVWFLGEPTAVQRRVVKAIGEQAGIPLEFKHVEGILRFAEAGAGSGKELALPLGWKVEREPDRLVFLTPDLREPAPQRDYEYALPVPGMVVVHEAGSEFEAQRVPGGTTAGYNPGRLLDAECLPGPLRVRNWRPGDRFWPAHTKSPKKIKELLQERHVALPQRRLWPVILSGDEIVWVRGFPLPTKLQAKPGRDAVFIAEKQLTEKAAM
jgi:tRNA(Ile)-lysidine synthase